MQSPKQVVIFGAGLVTRPMVQYLLDHGFRVLIASRTVSKAETLIKGHPLGRAEAFVIEDDDRLDKLIQESDLAVSLLPAVHHVKVARACLKHRKPMVTTSYVSPAMAELDKEARAAGLTILNELGLDPGIDHMSAMKLIHDIRNRGGKITEFSSCCGGLPAPEANDNPWGYKFSWSPRGVVLAGRNSARYLKDSKTIEVDGPDLFGSDCGEMNVDGVGVLEIYPNRDSIPYIEKYKLAGIESMFRGTLRYPGHCRTWLGLSRLGFLNDSVEYDLNGMTYSHFLDKVLLVDATGHTLAEKITGLTGFQPGDDSWQRLEWLGLLSDQPIPWPKKSALDVLADTMQQKMGYKPDERDMIVLRHTFKAVYGDREEILVSTLVDFGEPGGDSSMARTVSLPAAIGVRLILEGKITSPGVLIPVEPEIYEPILTELEEMDIRFVDVIK